MKTCQRCSGRYLDGDETTCQVCLDKDYCISYGDRFWPAYGVTMRGWHVYRIRADLLTGGYWLPGMAHTLEEALDLVVRCLNGW